MADFHRAREHPITNHTPIISSKPIKLLKKISKSISDYVN